MKNRCEWANKSIELQIYHDNEWGKKTLDDNENFELIVLEGAQAGLNWLTVLNKRDEYRKVFFNFDTKKCANIKDEYLEKQLYNKKIIRNKNKIFSVRKNAIAFLEIQKDFKSFQNYLDTFTQQKTFYSDLEQKQAKSIANAIAKDLKKRGMSFIGETIIDCYLRRIAITNPHEQQCFKYYK